MFTLQFHTKEAVGVAKISSGRIFPVLTITTDLILFSDSKFDYKLES
jgi:hypothetical protein